MRRISFAIVLLILSVAHIQAAIIVADPFTDGGRTDGSDPFDVAWYELNTGTTTTVNAQAESNITGSGLFVDSGGTFRSVVSQMPSAVELAAEGDSVVLSFDVRFFSNGTTATSTTPAVQGADAGFRFGLHNSNGTVVVVDGSGNSSNDFGYRAEIPIGPGTAALQSLLGESGTNGSILGGSDGSSLSPSGIPLRIADDAAYSVSFSITRTASGISVESVVYDGIGLTGSVVGSALGTDTGAVNNTNSQAGIFTIFDTIGFSSGATDYNYRLDNIQVSFNAVPEPGTWGMLGLGLAAGFCYFRRGIRAGQS